MLKNMLIITLQNTIQQLGPVPDQHGDMIRKILKEVDTTPIISLGFILDSCLKNKSYAELDKFKRDIEAYYKREEEKNNGK